MNYADWKDAEIVTIDGIFGTEKITINQYSWINAISVNAIFGILEFLVLMYMLLKVEGVTPFMVGVMAGVAFIILSVGSFLLKEDYVEEIIDEIHITENKK